MTILFPGGIMKGSVYFYTHHLKPDLFLKNLKSALTNA